MGGGVDHQIHVMGFENHLQPLESPAPIGHRQFQTDGRVLLQFGYEFFMSGVLLQVAQLGTEWRAVRFTLLGVSIVCYAARLGVTQYRQSRAEDMLERHNLAMDSAVNGKHERLAAGGRVGQIFVHGPFHPGSTMSVDVD